MRYFCRIKSAYYLEKSVFNFFERRGSASRCFVYTSEYTDSIVKSHKIITDLVKDNEEIYELMLKNRNLFFCACSLRKIASARISRSEIQRIRNIVRPYAHYTLKSKRYPLKWKLNFFLAVFAPIPVYKAVVMMWELLKKFRRKKYEDAFANWQDFPKAPGM